MSKTDLTPERVAEPDIHAAVASLNVAAFEPVIRRHAESIYEMLLGDVQDYLKENASFNIGSHIQMLERSLRDARAAEADAVEELARVRGALEAFDMREEDLVGAQGGHLIVRVPTSWFARRSAALVQPQETRG